MHVCRAHGELLHHARSETPMLRCDLHYPPPSTLSFTSIFAMHILRMQGATSMFLVLYRPKLAERDMKLHSVPSLTMQVNSNMQRRDTAVYLIQR
jgi:hypothetical protein